MVFRRLTLEHLTPKHRGQLMPYLADIILKRSLCHKP